jgi:hypothetical protein
MHSSEDGPAMWPQRSELRAWSLEHPLGGQGSWPHRDAIKMAKVFELVAEPEPAPPESHAGRAAAFAGIAGVVVGLLLALLLARTAFAPASHCHTTAGGASTCARDAR